VAKSKPSSVRPAPSEAPPAPAPPAALPSAPARIDPAIVANLYVEHGAELRNFLTGVLRNADLAGEVLQNTFSKCVEVGHTAREETLKGWLFRVAFHEALALKRRHGVEGRANQRLAGDAAADLNHRTHHSPGGEERLIRGETVEAVRLALEDLPPEQRQVVRMRMYEEKTFAVIAAELKLPLGTVLTRMRLALEKLRKRLDLRP
jgi:RNA polymerase sigma factor (sigma-70 family)